MISYKTTIIISLILVTAIFLSLVFGIRNDIKKRNNLQQEAWCANSEKWLSIIAKLEKQRECAYQRGYSKALEVTGKLEGLSKYLADTINFESSENWEIKSVTIQVLVDGNYNSLGYISPEIQENQTH